MLAPKSTRALSKQKSLIKEGKVKLLGSFSFWGMALLILDTAYWFDLIWRIEFESALIVVEIDLTWSLGFVTVELAFVEARISLIKLEFSSCLFADLLMNLLRVLVTDIH
ncbi:hypothetical protein Tco_1544187 [Tanacetum coccineum]